MAVFHFKLCLLPRSYFEASGSPIPTLLTEEDINRGESDEAGWWSRIQPSERGVVAIARALPDKHNVG